MNPKNMLQTWENIGVAVAEVGQTMLWFVTARILHNR